MINLVFCFYKDICDFTGKLNIYGIASTLLRQKMLYVLYFIKVLSLLHNNCFYLGNLGANLAHPIGKPIGGIPSGSQSGLPLFWEPIWGTPSGNQSRALLI